MQESVPVKIGANTRFIISTSGRPSSIERYRKLLQDILLVDIAYIPINSGSADNKIIDPQRFAYALKGFPCIGGAISKDIKRAIIPFLDEIEVSAEKVQSVNTVLVDKNGQLKGYNSDVVGFRHAIVNGVNNSGSKVESAICYGYGGVASVVTSVLQELGYKVYIIGRNAEIANTRAMELGVEFWSGQSAELFVNATPASERPLEMAPNLLESLKCCKIVFDHEMPGKYLQEYCDLHNVHHIKGLDMYYPQMYEQWRLFLQGIVEPDRIPELIKEADIH